MSPKADRILDGRGYALSPILIYHLTNPKDDDEDGGDNLEPISADNIIAGGRRTRGKTIDFQEAAEKIQGDDDDDDDEEFQPNDDDDNMRD